MEWVDKKNGAASTLYNGTIGIAQIARTYEDDGWQVRVLDKYWTIRQSDMSFDVVRHEAEEQLMSFLSTWGLSMGVIKETEAEAERKDRQFIEKAVTDAFKDIAEALRERYRKWG